MKKLFLVLPLVAAGSAQALVFDFQMLVGGGGVPDMPAARVTITQAGVDAVDVLVENLAASGTQFISQLWLNVDPFPGVHGESFSTPFVSVNWAENGNTAVGRTFDILVQLTTENPDRLGPTESASFQLTGSGLLESHFYSFSTGDNTDALAMVHINATNSNPGLSRHIISIVPEPASIAGFLLAGAALIARRRRR